MDAALLGALVLLHPASPCRETTPMWGEHERAARWSESYKHTSRHIWGWSPASSVAMATYLCSRSALSSSNNERPVLGLRQCHAPRHMTSQYHSTYTLQSSA